MKTLTLLLLTAATLHAAPIPLFDENTLGILRRFGDPEAGAERPAPWTDGKPEIGDDAVVVLTGQTNLAREQKAGNLEVSLATAWAAKRPRFRPMAWEADTVYEQWRDLNFGSWEGQLRSVGAGVVVAQFGQTEAMEGKTRLPEFVAAYHRLLDQFAAVTPRLVLVSPMPFEKPLAPDAPDLTLLNEDVKAYADAIRIMAAQRGAVYVDLFTPLSGAAGRRTANGMHLGEKGLAEVAALIAKGLGADPKAGAPEALRAAIVEKNRLWFDCWWPANWSFVYGDRTSQLYAKAAGDQPSLREAFESHKPLIAALDRRIHALALGEDAPPPQAPPAPPAAAHEAVSVAGQLASFTLAEGFEINLFAAEDLGVAKPVQIAWDERGRLLIACSPTYPQTSPGIKPSDFILVVEDTDGDGRGDKSTRFAEGLTMVQGVEPGAGGLYVCDYDRILHLRDTDGDGRADETSIVMSGFGIGDTHQLANSISTGPDGTLWFTQGLHVFSRIETPWGISRLDKAGVWRFNPRTLRLDGFFNGAAAGHNCWGVAFDDRGQMFHKSGDRPDGYYSLPGLVRITDPQNFHPVGKLFNSDRKTTSLDFIGTRAMPDELQGAAVIGGYFGSVVELHRLVDNGAGFSSKQLPRLVTSSNPAFRPVDVSIGPDGAIYVADWFNPTIGHYQASYASPQRDRTNGRIWRISAKGRDPVRQPDLAAMAPAKLLEQLKSPERWTRYHAKRLLFDAPRREVLAAADAWLAALDPAAEAYGQLLLELAGVYQAHQSPRPGLLAAMGAATDPAVRAYGARVAGDWKQAEHLTAASNDANPRVRLESIVASSYLESPLGVGIALNALHHPRDRFIDYALRHSVRAQEPWWRDDFRRGKLALAKPDHRKYLEQLLGAPKPATPPGQVVYEAVCLNCHQADARGLAGVYPALAGNALVKGDTENLIRILLHGYQSGPDSLPMPPMGLDDRQTADVLTYLRANFGNGAPGVSADQVAAVRQADADKRGFHKPAAIEAQGKPPK